jgi:hypothetical protein
MAEEAIREAEIVGMGVGRFEEETRTAIAARWERMRAAGAPRPRQAFSRESNARNLAVLTGATGATPHLEPAPGDRDAG